MDQDPTTTGDQQSFLVQLSLLGLVLGDMEKHMNWISTEPLKLEECDSHATSGAPKLHDAEANRRSDREVLEGLYGCRV